jgi:hypothetical protein
MIKEGYKLAKRFMNSKDIFKVVKNLLKVGYSCNVVETDKNDPYYKHGYFNHILVKYVGDKNKSILPLYVFFKDNKQESQDGFKQHVQVRYYE